MLIYCARQRRTQFSGISFLGLGVLWLQENFKILVKTLKWPPHIIIPQSGNWFQVMTQCTDSRWNSSVHFSSYDLQCANFVSIKCGYRIFWPQNTSTFFLTKNYSYVLYFSLITDKTDSTACELPMKFKIWTSFFISNFMGSLHAVLTDKTVYVFVPTRASTSYKFAGIHSSSLSSVHSQMTLTMQAPRPHF